MKATHRGAKQPQISVGLEEIVDAQYDLALARLSQTSDPNFSAYIDYGMAEWVLYLMSEKIRSGL